MDADQYGSKGKQAPSLRESPRPEAKVVEEFHTNSDLDVRPESLHHTLGSGPSQASPGNHVHNGSDAPLLLVGVTLTGSRGAATAMPSLISALVKLGAVDSTTA